MLFENLTGGSSMTPASTVLVCFFLVICAFLSITAHEYAHSAACIRMGGEAKKTLNPLKSVTVANIISVILLAIFSVSWTKSSETRLTRGKAALVALMGPLMNLFLAVVCIFLYDIIYVISANLYASTESAPVVLNLISTFLSAAVLVNVAYFLFNLLPVPGLDGGNIFAQILPEKVRTGFLSFSKHSYIILLFIVVIASRSGIASSVLSAVSGALETPFLAVLNILFPV